MDERTGKWVIMEIEASSGVCEYISDSGTEAKGKKT